jgi:hypothetical protein
MSIQLRNRIASAERTPTAASTRCSRSSRAGASSPSLCAAVSSGPLGRLDALSEVLPVLGTALDVREIIGAAVLRFKKTAE